MACEACSAKFTLFKRKRQCTDCLRYFCVECVIKRGTKMFSCDNCSALSRRPLVRSQVAQMRARDLRQYLMAKKVSVRGCVEKDDLVSLVMSYANGTDDRSRTNETPVEAQDYTESQRTNRNSYTNQMRLSNQENVNMSMEDLTEEHRNRPEVPSNFPSDLASNETEAQYTVQESPNEGDRTNNDNTEERTQQQRTDNVEIEEVSASDCSPNSGPEPVISEHEETSEIRDRQSSETFTEIPVWADNVKLSDINKLSELEYLSVKQLKNLLSTNRVDFKGCVERKELLDRASRLWEEYKQSRIDVEKLDEEDVCKICWDAPIECVILECGHMACCINCGKQMSECPICKQYVVRVVRFFKS